MELSSNNRGRKITSLAKNKNSNKKKKRNAIKQENQHLARVKADWLLRLEAFKNRPKRKLSRQWKVHLQPGTRSYLGIT